MWCHCRVDITRCHHVHADAFLLLVGGVRSHAMSPKIGIQGTGGAYEHQWAPLQPTCNVAMIRTESLGLSLCLPLRVYYNGSALSLLMIDGFHHGEVWRPIQIDIEVRATMPDTDYQSPISTISRPDVEFNLLRQQHQVDLHTQARKLGFGPGVLTRCNGSPTPRRSITVWGMYVKPV